MADEAVPSPNIVQAFLRAATDDDIARLSRAISPEPGLTLDQRRAGFETVITDIFERIGGGAPKGRLVMVTKIGDPYVSHARVPDLPLDRATTFSDAIAKRLAGDGEIVTAHIADIVETRYYRDGALLQSGRHPRIDAWDVGPNERLDRGDYVVLRRDVHRPPHAMVPAGAFGVVEGADDDFVTVALDEPVPGLEPWGNRLHWYWRFDRVPGATMAQVVRADIEDAPLSP